LLEVTDGMFWKPYGSASGQTSGVPERSGVPAGMDANEYRPPIDLPNAKLRGLAAALGPVYARVSGTWANTMHFANADPAPSSPPSGFNGVLSREPWKGFIDFAAAAVYADCQRGAPGGVTLLVINNAQTETVIEIPHEGKHYTFVRRAAGERRC
jgi:hypothetical protein